MPDITLPKVDTALTPSRLYDLGCGYKLYGATTVAAHLEIGTCLEQSYLQHWRIFDPFYSACEIFSKTTWDGLGKYDHSVWYTYRGVETVEIDPKFAYAQMLGPDLGPNHKEYFEYALELYFELRTTARQRLPRQHQ